MSNGVWRSVLTQVYDWILEGKNPLLFDFSAFFSQVHIVVATELLHRPLSSFEQSLYMDDDKYTLALAWFLKIHLFLWFAKKIWKGTERIWLMVANTVLKYERASFSSLLNQWTYWWWSWWAGFMLISNFMYFGFSNSVAPAIKR